MGTVLVNYSGKTRKATINGREYIVAKATLIVPGVLSGSKGALYYPPEEIAKNYDAWNGIPLTNGHPAVNGDNVSARNPSIIQSHGLGHVYNVNITKNGRLRGEAWFDVKSCERVRPEILNKLKSGEPIELSTGLFTNNVPANNGAHHNGRQYTHVARDYRPDHLAILMDQQGACSLRDGCGVLTDNGRWVTTDDGNHLFLDDKGRTLMTGPSGKEIEGGGKKGKAEKPDRKKTEDQDGVFKSKHDGTEYKSKDDRDSDDRYFTRLKNKAKKSQERHDKLEAGFKEILAEEPDFTEVDALRAKSDAGKKSNSKSPKLEALEKAKAKLEAVKKAGPTSPRVEALKAAKAKVEAKIGKLKQKLGNVQESRQINEKVLAETPSPAPIKKTISDADWDNAVAGLEKSREAYRQARKAGKKGEAKSRLADARRFRKTLLGNAVGWMRMAQLVTLNIGKNEMHDFDESGVCVKCKGHFGLPTCSSKPTENAMACTLNAAGFCVNCGGKGGKPGPCPSGKNEGAPLIGGNRDIEHALDSGKVTEQDFANHNTGAQTARDAKNVHVGSKVRISSKVGGGVGHVVGFDNDGSFAAVKIKGEVQSFHNSDLKRWSAKTSVPGSVQVRGFPTQNSFSGDDMATKKEKMVAFLTTNCDCWKGEKDAEILSNFDEGKLKTLIDATKEAIANSAAIHEIKDAFGAEAEGLTVNAMPAFVKGKALAKAPPEEMEDAEEEPAESEMEEVVAPPAKKGKKKMPVVANSSTARPEQPPTLNEWLASAPVEVQEVIRTAQAVERGAKETIVKSLVGNSQARTKQDREELAKFLMTKPLAELNTLSKLSVNRAKSVRDPMDFLAAPAKPAPTVNYGGLGEDFDDDEPTANEDTVLDAPLGCPTANVDWAAEAKLIPTGKRK